METVKNNMDYIKSILGQRYEKVSINDRECFRLPNGIIVHVDAFENNGTAFVVEYADDINEAGINRFEDGDLFYPQDYDSEKDFAGAILGEIQTAE